MAETYAQWWNTSKKRAKSRHSSSFETYRYFSVVKLIQNGNQAFHLIYEEKRRKRRDAGNELLQNVQTAQKRDSW